MKYRLLPHVILLFLLFSGIKSNLNAQTWDTLAPIPESFTFPVVAVVNGKIHVMGGGGVGGATNHHYAYDPATNTWIQRANVPYRAQQPAGAAVNGKIHFFGGGYPNSGSPLSDHYIYDPVTNTWEQGGSLTAPRAIHYGVGLDNVLYTLAGQGVTNLCQIYDENGAAWITKNNLPDNSFAYGAHVVAEGHIYRFGGGGYTAPKNFAQRYNPATDTWVNITPLEHANHGISGAAIGHKIYLAGGYYDFVERDEVLIFDTDTETYSPGVPLPLGRNYHSMVAIDSCIYVVGGNHAIDQTVTFQLLRFCPNQSASPIREIAGTSRLNARFALGNLYLNLPENLQGPAQISIFDLEGKQLFAEKQNLDGTPNLEICIGNLVPSIYLVRLQTEKGMFAAKITAN